MAERVTAFVLRVGLGLLFLYTGALKARDIREFAFAVENYRLTAPWATDLIAFYLPWMEIFAAIAVLSRQLYLGGLAAFAGMMALFIGAVGSAWWRGLDITCGCFGPAENRTDYPLHLGLNLALLAAIGVLFALEARRMQRSGSGSFTPRGDSG